MLLLLIRYNYSSVYALNSFINDKIDIGLQVLAINIVITSYGRK